VKHSESLFFHNLQSTATNGLPKSLNLKLQTIAQDHLKDLSPTHGRHYASEVQDQITIEAARRFRQLVMNEMNSTLTDARLSELWRSIVTDFHRNANWGHKPELKSKPRSPLTHEQKISNELFPYVWALVQAVVVMKAAVYYFGMQSSNEPSFQNDIFFALALIISFGSLFIFAWRKSEPTDKGN